MSTQSGTSRQAGAIGIFCRSVYEVMSSKIIIGFAALMLVSAGAYQVNQIYHPPIQEGTFSIDTSGSTAEKVGNTYSLEIPLAFANGTENIVYDVVLNVTVYGCARAKSPLSSCVKIDEFEEHYPMKASPGTYVNLTHQRTGRIGKEQDNEEHDSLRVVTSLESMLDDRDMADERETARLENPRQN